MITPIDTHSGINLTLEVATDRINKTAEELCEIAKSLGLQMVPLSEISGRQTSALIFYYSGLPLAQVDERIRTLVDRWHS